MKKILLIGLVISLSACSSYNPVYDPKSSKDGGKNYYADMQECVNTLLIEILVFGLANISQNY